jgi:hypothetical protein
LKHTMFFPMPNRTGRADDSRVYAHSLAATTALVAEGMLTALSTEAVIQGVG